MVPQNLFMLALFGDFYYKTYIQEKKPHKKGDANKKGDNDDNNNSPPIAVEYNNNGTIKTMANGNGITCRNNMNNYYSSGTAKANGISSS